MIPIDDIGYSVEPDTGIIHTRYATHGDGTRTRTMKGAQSILGKQKAKPCAECYPSPQYIEPATP